MPYANNKAAGQPAHPRSLISAFVVRSLDSIISLVSISIISTRYLASVAAQTSLCLTLSQTPKTGFLVAGLKSCYKQGMQEKESMINVQYELEILSINITGTVKQIRRGLGIIFHISP